MKPIMQRDLGTRGQSRAEVSTETLSTAQSQGCCLPCMGFPCSTHTEQPKSCSSLTQETVLGEKQRYQGRITLNTVRELLLCPLE